MAAPVFSVKRKPVPVLHPDDFFHPTATKPQPVLRHTINLAAHVQLVPEPASPRRRKLSSSLRKIFSLSRINTSLPSKVSKDAPPAIPTSPSHSSGAAWRPLSPLSPQSSPSQSAFSRATSVLSHSRISSSCTSASAHSRHCSSLYGAEADDEEDDDDDDDRPFPPIPARDPTTILPSPASQKSLLTSWYDTWFETQSIGDQQPSQPQGLPSEPRSFFEDDSDDEPPYRSHQVGGSDDESDYSSIIPDCSNSDEDSDAGEDEDEDATLTVGTRVVCRRASCRLFSASGSSSEELSTRPESDSRSQSATPRNRRAFELDRSQY